jgi:hypothetical protein
MVYVRANASAGQRSTTKGGRVRAVPLVDELARRLDELSKREHWTDDDDYVFATDGGARIDDKDARAYFYDALAAAGLSQLRADVDKHGDPQKPIVFHDLRHSYCSWAVDVWPIPDVQVFAGHRDISTTMKSSTARRRPRTHRRASRRSGRGARGPRGTVRRTVSAALWNGPWNGLAGPAAHGVPQPVARRWSAARLRRLPLDDRHSDDVGDALP